MYPSDVLHVVTTQHLPLKPSNSLTPETIKLHTASSFPPGWCKFEQLLENQRKDASWRKKKNPHYVESTGHLKNREILNRSQKLPLRDQRLMKQLLQDGGESSARLHYSRTIHVSLICEFNPIISIFTAEGKNQNRAKIRIIILKQHSSRTVQLNQLELENTRQNVTSSYSLFIIGWIIIKSMVALKCKGNRKETVKTKQKVNTCNFSSSILFYID